MGLIQRFLLGNRVEDDLQVGLFLKNDGTVWLRNPDGSETQVSGGGGGALTSSLTLTAEQLQNLNSEPVQLVAGVDGFVAFPILLTAKYVFGTVPYGHQNNGRFLWGDLFWNSVALPDITQSTDNASADNPGDFSVIPTGPLSGSPLFLQTADTDPGSWGAVETATLGAGGAGYAPGDTGVIAAGNTDATYSVDSVDGDGAVTAFTVTAAGTGYQVADGQPTQVSTGGGDGNFTVNVTSVIPGDGTLQMVTSYFLVATI